MSVSLPVVFVTLAWICGDLFLLFTLAGIATVQDQTVATKLWGILGVLAIFFGANAYLLDQLGEHFGY